MDNLSLSIGIGATLAASVDATISLVPKKLTKIGDALAAIEQRDQKLKFLEGATADLDKNRAKLVDVGEELKKLKAAMQNAGAGEIEAFTRRAAKLERQQEGLTMKLAGTGVELMRVKNAMQTASGAPLEKLTRESVVLERQQDRLATKLTNVGEALAKTNAVMQSAKANGVEALTKKSAALERQQATLTEKVKRGEESVQKSSEAYREASAEADKYTGRLGKMGQSVDLLREKQEKLKTAAEKHGQAQEKLGRARAGLFDAWAIGSSLKTMVQGTGELQSKLVDIGITADIPRQRIGEIGLEIKRLARETGQSGDALVSGFQVLVASGLDEKSAMASLSAIGKTATASGAEVEDVSRTVFSLLDNLKVAPEEAIKAMDMLTAAGKAGRFELADMARYFPAMTSDAAKLGITGTKGVASLGAALQIALKGAADPSQAATNMENYMSQLTAPRTLKRFGEMGVDLEKKFASWGKKGLNPIEESLKLIQKLTKGDAFRIGELFGNQQAKSFITPMLANMGEGGEYWKIKEQVENAAGTVDADKKRREEEDPTFKWRAMGEALAQLRDGAIVPLLPVISQLITEFVKITAPVTEFMNRNQALIAVIGSVFGGLLAGKVAFAALAYGISIVTTAMTALNLAFTASPIGLALKILAAGALAVWANWDKIGPWFNNLFSGIGKWASDSWASIQTAWSEAGHFFSGICQDIGNLMKTGVMMLTEDLPRLFVDLGKSMVGGLIGGIGDMGSALKDSVVGIASNSANWFKEKLGISSPSRVFMNLGEMVGEGAAIGIGSMGNAVSRAAAGLGVAASLAFQPTMASEPPSALETTAMMRRSAPTAPTASPLSTAPVTNHFSISIVQRPGEDAEALARRVVELIRRKERIDRRAGLGDWGND